MAFDFSAVSTPFRMQPGLRKLAPGTVQLTPLAPGSRHQREKLAVLSVFASQALLQRPGFDAAPALDALAAHAAAEHPQHFGWDGHRAVAHRLRTAVEGDRVELLGAGDFGLGDEIGRCLLGLPPAWRLAGLLCLSFAEDFAVVDGGDATIPWLAVCLPSNWAPEEKIGRHFAEVHAPVADNRLIVGASEALTKLVTGSERWERFVWTITRHPRLHAHPARCDPQPWPAAPDADALAALAFFRTERQTFIPRPDRREAVFTIGVDVRPLVQSITEPAQAQLLHDALASMSPAVLAYRSLAPARDRLLDWLARRTAA
jgi:hypothetical protein